MSVKWHHIKIACSHAAPNPLRTFLTVSYVTDVVSAYSKHHHTTAMMLELSLAILRRRELHKGNSTMSAVCLRCCCVSVLLLSVCVAADADV